MVIPTPTQADPARRAPGRPRSQQVDDAIIDAVLDLLAEGTAIEALSIEAVANRAGVGKAAIYRRWSNKEDLVVHALAALKGPPPELRGESVRDDLISLLDGIRRNKEARAGRIMPCLIPEVQRNPSLYERYQALIEPRRQLVRDTLQRGIDSGELRADLDIELVLAVLTGPMLAQNLRLSSPNVDPVRMAEGIVDTVLTGIRGTGSAAT